MGIRMSNKLENLGDAVPDVSLRQLGDHEPLTVGVDHAPV